MAMTAEEIARLIRAGLPDAEITVEDLAGDGNHYRAHVVSPVFRGKTRVACQRLVYKAIAPLMAGDRAPVHAVDQLETRVP